MGANGERGNALRTAIRRFPSHSLELWRRYHSGNSALTAWHDRMSHEGRRHTVIVMIERLGDIVACSPIAQQLKARDPTLSIAWVCSNKYAEALAGNPYIDAIFHEESLTGWLLSKRHLRQPLDCYELFLDTQRCCWTGMRLPGRRSGITHQNYLNTGSNLLLAYSRAAAIPEIQNIEPDLYLTPAVSMPPSNLGKPLLAIHFDSEDPDRRLSAEAGSAFVAAALKKGWSIVELGLRPIAAKTSSHVFFPGKTYSLAQQILTLKTADHFVGVDSAFLHCANAYRIPSTLFLGKFRHFINFTTFSGSFLMGNASTLVRGSTPPREFSPDLICSFVPNLPANPTKPNE